MEFFSGLSIVGVILVTWAVLSLAAALVIWPCLVASKGLRPFGPKQTTPAGDTAPVQLPQQHARAHRLVPVERELAPQVGLHR